MELPRSASVAGRSTRAPAVPPGHHHSRADVEEDGGPVRPHGLFDLLRILPAVALSACRWEAGARQPHFY